MKVEYYSDTDTLSIVLTHTPDGVSVDDTNDRDISLLYDSEDRVVEIIIEHASSRTDLDSVREQLSFEEMGSSGIASSGNKQ